MRTCGNSLSRGLSWPHPKCCRRTPNCTTPTHQSLSTIGQHDTAQKYVRALVDEQAGFAVACSPGYLACE